MATRSDEEIVEIWDMAQGAAFAVSCSLQVEQAVARGQSREDAVATVAAEFETPPEYVDALVEKRHVFERAAEVVDGLADELFETGDMVEQCSKRGVDLWAEWDALDEDANLSEDDWPLGYADKFASRTGLTRGQSLLFFTVAQRE